MLPPKLSKLKTDLEKKGVSRSKEENELLEELKILDKGMIKKGHLNEDNVRAFGPLGNVCSECGRPY